jgi:hypothetical protein
MEWMIQVSIPDRDRKSLLSKMFRLFLGPNQPPIRWIPGVLCPGGEPSSLCYLVPRSWMRGAVYLLSLGCLHGMDWHYIELFLPILTAVETVCVEIGSHECWLLWLYFTVGILTMVWVFATYSYIIHEDSSLLECQIISKHQQLFVSQYSETSLKTWICVYTVRSSNLCCRHGSC